MSYKRTILYGNEYMQLHANGAISRPGIGMSASGQWIVTGAVARNNFGNVTRRFTLAEILGNPASIPWRNKNGSQRVFIQDIDHGTRREWRSPPHIIF